MDFFAYLDPGSGSLFIQSVIGASLAIAVVFRNVLGRITLKARNLLSRRSAKNEE